MLESFLQEAEKARKERRRHMIFILVLAVLATLGYFTRESWLPEKAAPVAVAAPSATAPTSPQ